MSSSSKRSADNVEDKILAVKKGKFADEGLGGGAGSTDVEDLVLDVDVLDDDTVDNLAGSIEEDNMGADVDEEMGDVDPALDNAVVTKKTQEEELNPVLDTLGVPHIGTKTWKDSLLCLCKNSANDNYQAQLTEFIEHCGRSENRGKSLVNPNRFVDGTFGLQMQHWDSHDLAIDAKWSTFVADIVDMSNGAIEPEFLTKPSGPLNAALTFVWHYPTWVTAKPSWGHVMDRTNPSLRAQYARVGPSPFVRTQDRLPIREHFVKGGVDWAGKYPNWHQIEKRCLEFQRWLNKSSKVIIVVGQDNAASVEDLVEVDETCEIIDVELQLRMDIFGQQAKIRIIRQKTSNKIKHVIFLCYHSQYFYHDVKPITRAYQDLIWNAACEFAGVEFDKPRYFSTQPEWLPNLRLDKGKTLRYMPAQVQQARILRGCEKTSGILLSEVVVRRALSKTLSKNPTFVLHRDVNGSFVGAILRLFISKQWAKRKTPEWLQTPEAEKWRQSCVGNLGANKQNHARSAATQRAKWQSKEWRESEGGQKALAAIKDGVKRRQGRVQAKPGARLAAFMRVKQVQDRLKADPSTLNKFELQTLEKLKQMPSLTSRQHTEYFRNHVAFYNSTCPRGLRFEGDGGPAEDDFQYEEMNHPAVRLEGVWTTALRKQFEDGTLDS